MASELKHHVGYSRENECWFVRFYPYQTEQQAKDAVSAFTRPAPAATDTGLVTVGDGYLDNAGRLSRGSHTDCIALGFRRVSLVDRSQAEELLAAERAEKEKERLRFEGDLDKWMKIIGAGITGYQPEAYALMDLACEELVKLRADNAAQAARIKELEEEVEWAQNAVLARQRHAEARCEALEAKLAAAEKALTMIANIELSFPEELRDIARAVLGGKPSC